MEKQTTVVHCMKEPYDVYCGRGKCPKTGKPGKFGNPWSHNPSHLAVYRVDTREEAISKHMEYVLRDVGLMMRIKKELTGKVLGCWCKPKACHCDLYVDICNGIYDLWIADNDDVPF